MTERETQENKAWQSEESYIKLEYDRAYYRFVFCSEAEKPEAQRLLAIWRSKYFNH
jgi:hypothetical protein